MASDECPVNVQIAFEEKDRILIEKLMGKIDRYGVAIDREISGLLDVMLGSAQTLRIQQSQATADWEQKYRDIANNAWREFNKAHEKLYKMLLGECANPLG